MLVHWGREVEQGHPGVYDVEEDEAHLALGKWVAKQTKGAGIPNLVQVFNQY